MVRRSDPEHPSDPDQRAASASDPPSLDAVLASAYDELRRLADRYLARERAGQTLQPTGLVHEAYLRLRKEGRAPWKNVTHFRAIAANSMRQILIERARARNAQKRGGELIRVTLGDAAGAAAEDQGIDVEALDAALTRLAELDPTHARLVELRYFGGLTIEETAEALSVSPATVKRDWALARAWLRRELESHDAPPA